MKERNYLKQLNRRKHKICDKQTQYKKHVGILCIRTRLTAFMHCTSNLAVL